MRSHFDREFRRMHGAWPEDIQAAPEWRAREAKVDVIVLRERPRTSPAQPAEALVMAPVLLFGGLALILVGGGSLALILVLAVGMIFG